MLVFGHGKLLTNILFDHGGYEPFIDEPPNSFLADDGRRDFEARC